MKQYASWNNYPAVRKLFDRILEHRRICPYWKANNPCHNCHFDTLTKIEEELGIR